MCKLTETDNANELSITGNFSELIVMLFNLVQEANKYSDILFAPFEKYTFSKFSQKANTFAPKIISDSKVTLFKDLHATNASSSIYIRLLGRLSS